MEKKKNKHLTIEDRNEIQQCLDHGMTFKAIAARIGKDQTTVSKEVKKHLTYTPSKVVHRDSSGKELPPPVCPKLIKTPFVCNPCEKKDTVARFKSKNTLPSLPSKSMRPCLLRLERASR